MGSFAGIVSRTERSDYLERFVAGLFGAGFAEVMRCSHEWHGLCFRWPSAPQIPPLPQKLTPMIATRIDQAHPSASNQDRNLERRVLNCLRLRIQNLGTIEVEAQDGTVILSGVAPSQSMKWRCGECCRCVAGVLNVVDRLVVQPSHLLQEVDTPAK